jgi:hypothetical protein
MSGKTLIGKTRDSGPNRNYERGTKLATRGDQMEAGEDWRRHECAKIETDGFETPQMRNCTGEKLLNFHFVKFISGIGSLVDQDPVRIAVKESRHPSVRLTGAFQHLTIAMGYTL